MIDSAILFFFFKGELEKSGDSYQVCFFMLPLVDHPRLASTHHRLLFLSAIDLFIFYFIFSVEYYLEAQEETRRL